MAEVPGWTEGIGIPGPIERFELPIFPDLPELWDFAALMFDYDPRPALERIRVPVLAVFGGGGSSRACRGERGRLSRRGELGSPDGRGLPGSESQRVLVGEPPELADGYLETLSAFVARVVS